MLFLKIRMIICSFISENLFRDFRGHMGDSRNLALVANPTHKDIKKYYTALQKAQHDIDLRPELYTHYYKEEFPERFHEMMDLRYFGPGERIVFDKYSETMYDQSRVWVSERDIFPEGDIGDRNYADAKYTPV